MDEVHYISKVTNASIIGIRENMLDHGTINEQV